ncbi:MAG: methyltransferase domain-containing protein [Nanoarchaeota archaeon]|nr:methyltransferase domain-containing protein [Nanoarchaeota archaeon]
MNQHIAESKEHFNNWSKKYDSSLLQKFFFHPIQQTVIQNIARHTDEEFSLLDVGCGTGKMLNQISRKWPNAQLTGADISEKMITQSQQKNPSLEFKTANAQDLPFEDNTFNYTTNTVSFHHYPEPQTAVNEFYRVTKPCGVVLIADLIYPIMLGKGSVKAYSPKAMRQFFQQAGFKEIRQQRPGYFLFPGIITRLTIGTKFCE